MKKKKMEVLTPIRADAKHGPRLRQLVEEGNGITRADARRLLVSRFGLTHCAADNAVRNRPAGTTLDAMLRSGVRVNAKTSFLELVGRPGGTKKPRRKRARP
jgi:hypothetical protein